MCQGQMVDWWENTKDVDPITPHLIQKIFEQDSRSVKKVGEMWNLPWLEQGAQYNLDNPERGIANASLATGAGFLGAAGGAGGLFGSEAAYGAATPGVSQGSQQAAMLAAQTGEFGGYGLGATMQAAAMAEGLTPATSTVASYAGQGLMNASNPANRYAMRQGINMMQPEEPKQPQYRPPPPPQQSQPVPPIYGGMSEEEKRRLREQGYNIY